MLERLDDGGWKVTCYGCKEEHVFDMHIYDKNQSNKEQIEFALLFLCAKNYYLGKSSKKILCPKCVHEITGRTPKSINSQVNLKNYSEKWLESQNPIDF